MIKRLLIANRGEIALRIIRACRELGIEPIAVHSAIDARAPHVLAADRAYEIGPAPAVDSYLSIDRVIDAARRSRADAVHPGYGFLAENPRFAAACDAAGLVFVGPPADVIERLGSKIAARSLARAAGIPVVPGETPEDQSIGGIATAAARAGYPVLIKASAGGGGKGMRVVRAASELADLVESARGEALAAFGDGVLYVERLLDRPRHVEIQVIADAHGATVHLFERDCSVQRRHQKIIEETPSTALSNAMRTRMGEAAVELARRAAYRNAGTFEFLVSGTQDEARFYFLEVNTRLQVEHPITELVTGIDLVRAQLEIASGGRLSWKQGEIGQLGHAVECRVYAEDPENGFLPQAGRLALYREPSGPGIRVDSGTHEGADVPVHYDPLIAKLCAHAATREHALARCASALRRFPVLGITCNIPFLLRTIEHPAFRAGEIHTGFVDEHLASLIEDGPVPAAALAAAAMDRALADASIGQRPTAAVSGVDPWQTLSRWKV